MRPYRPNALGAQRVLGEVERETIGVVELEGRLAVELVTFGKIGRSLRQKVEAALQGLAEARFLQLQRFRDQRFGADEFRIGPAHLAHERRQELPHQRIPRAEQLCVAHGAAHDSAQHVTAAFVRR